MQNNDNGTELDARSLELRRLVVRGLEGGRRGHIGPSMSPMEILRVLYDEVMHFDPKSPDMADRDRCILSKGHGCLSQYALLADKGFIDAAELDKFCHFEAVLGGHPEAYKIPGIEASTGSLGHGLSIGVGMALSARMQKRDSRVYVIMGDGEINEGSVWEAALCAGKHRLNNLIAIIDYNKIQSAGTTAEIQDLEPLADKWRSFGFHTVEVDGHDLDAIRAVFKACPENNEKPTAIIAHTVKGKGIPFAENDPNWHHKSSMTSEMIQSLYDCLEPK